MTATMEPKHIAFTDVYKHYLDKVDNGRFSGNPPEIRTLIDYVMNHSLGCPIASSYTGIGSQITNGFVQFVVNNPVRFSELSCWLVDVLNHFNDGERPVVTIRTKNIPKEYATPQYNQHIVVMFRTPKFRDRRHANQWWTKLEKIVQSYSS